MIMITGNEHLKCFARSAFSPDGWQIENPIQWDGVSWQVERTASTIVLLDLDCANIAASAFGALGASGTDAFAGPPLLGYGRSVDADARQPGMTFDAFIAPTDDPVRLRAALHDWLPDDPAVRARLARAFGRASFDRLLGTCRSQLIEVSAAISVDVAGAHRLAGLAGTLGFARTAGAWRAFSEGDRGALPAARAATRQAIWTITQELAVDYRN